MRETDIYCLGNSTSSVHIADTVPVGSLRYEDASPELQKEARIQLTLAGVDPTGHTVYLRPIIRNYLEYQGSGDSPIYYLLADHIATVVPDPSNPTMVEPFPDSDAVAEVSGMGPGSRIQKTIPNMRNVIRTRPPFTVYGRCPNDVPPETYAQASVSMVVSNNLRLEATCSLSGTAIPDVRNASAALKFDLYITIEPDLSPAYGTQQYEMFLYWAKLLQGHPKLDHLANIMLQSSLIHQMNEKSFNEMEYGLFPAGNSVHATSILYVKSGKYLESGYLHHQYW